MVSACKPAGRSTTYGGRLTPAAAANSRGAEASSARMGFRGVIASMSAPSSSELSRWLRTTPGVSYSADLGPKACNRMAPSVVPGMADATGSRPACAMKSPRLRSAPSKARQKVDLPTLLAPTTYTSRPLRSRSTAPAIAPTAALRSSLQRGAATIAPMICSPRRPSSSASHARTAPRSASRGRRSAFVPTARTGLPPMDSRRRPRKVPLRSVRSTSSNTSTAWSLRDLSEASSSSCDTKPRASRPVMPCPSTALTIAPCASASHRAHSNSDSWW
mmetsp:Transcript_17660/g.54832  ORF Transcript_17660/g.54832 Transcript_17660/m.54832 type:complete len:275 (+) Transcript_17660:2377-3201(+)